MVDLQDIVDCPAGFITLKGFSRSKKAGGDSKQDTLLQAMMSLYAGSMGALGSSKWGA